jgi:predicted glutamine amidotransferase
MCQILILEPGASIPADKLALTCSINKHGFGLSHVSASRVHTQKSVKDNDPEFIGAALDKLKKFRRFLHLRHATVGEINPANSHPFVILSKVKAGADIGLMHNGTLYEYRPKDPKSPESDTYKFANDFVVPLAKRIRAYTGPKQVLLDPMMQYFVRKEVGYGGSVVVLFDSFGNTFIVNKDKGKQYDGFWASNDYSFMASHARNNNYTPYHQGTHRTVDNDLPWMEDQSGTDSYPYADWERELALDDAKEEARKRREAELAEAFKPSDNSFTAKVKLVQGYKELGERIRNSVYKKDKSIMSATGTVMVDLRGIRKNFKDMTGLTSLNDLGRLTEQDFRDMCKSHPEQMANLIIDMLAENATLAYRNETQAKAIRGLTDKPGDVHPQAL